MLHLTCQCWWSINNKLYTFKFLDRKHQRIIWHKWMKCSHNALLKAEQMILKVWTGTVNLNMTVHIKISIFLATNTEKVRLFRYKANQLKMKLRFLSTNLHWRWKFALISYLWHQRNLHKLLKFETTPHC